MVCEIKDCIVQWSPPPGDAGKMVRRDITQKRLKLRLKIKGAPDFFVRSTPIVNTFCDPGE